MIWLAVFAAWAIAAAVIVTWIRAATKNEAALTRKREELRRLEEQLRRQHGGRL